MKHHPSLLSHPHECMLVCKLPLFFVLTVEISGLAFIKLLQEPIVQLLGWELKKEIGALPKKKYKGISIKLFKLCDTWWTPALDVRETVFNLWSGCAMSPGCRFICAEKGTGGWRAPWPLERAVTSPAITWLRPTPSRQKSKPFFFFPPMLLCLLYLSPEHEAINTQMLDDCFLISKNLKTALEGF